ncbi:MAG TPA: hypothetical protein VLA28_00660 [Afifellaceae bacterium]|nr:hypothetical protein [Afifellaceae bacterium]
MTVTTLDSFTGRAKEKTRKPGLFARFFKALIVSRERTARRYVNGYLLSLDDKTLAELGYNRAEIANSDVGVAYRY